MMKRFFIKVVLFVCVSLLLNDSCLAQHIMVYDASYSYKRIRWEVGDDIALKLYENKKIIHQGILSYISDSMVTLNGKTDIPIESISHILDYEKNSLIRFMQKLFTISSYTLLVVSGGNELIQSSENNEPYIVAAIAGVGLSYGLKPFGKRTYRIRKNHPIKILDIGIN